MLPNKLFHYSKEDINSLNMDHYLKYINSPNIEMKPKGIWVSVEQSEEDYSWFDWCVNAQFRLEYLRYKYFVRLSENINIIHLKTSQELESFSIEYKLNEFYGIENTSTFVCLIDWAKLKEKYDGIIISPYQWKCRLSKITFWYYGWDCSSGCIWNIDKIKLEFYSLIDFESLKEREFQEEENEMDSQQASQDLLT